ncbi:MAG: PQQ-binding-like beta-propeller repeat protein [Thermoguttaceae bacterium]
MMVKKLLVVIGCVAMLSWFLVDVRAQQTSLRGPMSTSSVATLGLKRDWYFQIKLDRDRAKLTHVIYDDKTFFAITDDAMLHAINAETGGYLWSVSVGDREAITLEPAVNSRIVAVVNGTTVTAYDRFTGKLVWQAKMPGVPLGGCSLSENYIYIPQMGGKIIAYNFDYNLGEDIAQVVTRSNAEKPKTLTDDPNFDKLDDPMKDVVRAFEKTKRDVLPSPTEKTPVQSVTLNPVSATPIVMAVSGRIWLAPTVCWQRLRYGLPAEKLRDDYAGKVNYGDFLVIEHAEQVAWVSSLGNVFLATIENLSLDSMQMRYDVRVAPRSFSFDREAHIKNEVSEGDPIVAQPTYVRQKPMFPVEDEKIERPSMLLVGTTSGYVFAIEDKVGRVCWQFSAQGPVLDRICVIEDVAYATVEDGGMHAIDIMTGKEKWFAPQIRHFIAASPKRLYATGLHDVAIVLDRETGRVIARGGSLGSHNLNYANTKNDQIFLANSDGLIQAFREMSQNDDDSVEQAITVWEKPIREIVEEKKRFDAPDDEFRAILDGIVEARRPKLKAEKPATKPKPVKTTPPKTTPPKTAKPAPTNDDDPFADPFADNTPSTQSTNADPFGDEPAGAATTKTPSKINLDEDDPFK